MTLTIAILASHGGSNAQAIIDACARGTIDARVAGLISNNSSSLALERARKAGIPAMHMSSVTHGESLDAAMCKQLQALDIELVALAGYMKQLGPAMLGAFEGRIVNIHPALLPRHGGRGMFGSRVHEAVLAAGDQRSGATVHLVDSGYDTGAQLAQAEVPVLPDDTVETLAARVLEVEHRLYPETIGKIARGEIVI